MTSYECRFIGHSDPVRRIHADIDCAARTDAKVLITGETGVGKEVVAHLIHKGSPRARGRLITVNCAGLADSLLESELFGHARGSFTGAYRDKPGLLETAANGTVFLDEVGEMSARMQSVLLRFLETGEIQRVGTSGVHRQVDVRLITATNRDLRSQTESGAFREDLYFRLNVIRLCIPPLRDRSMDIPLLVNHFIDLYCRQHAVVPPVITPAAMERLRDYRWPGNVRELRNVVERVVLKVAGQPVTPDDLPSDVFAVPNQPHGHASDHLVTGAHAFRAEELAAQMLDGGASFWSTVYPRFMSRDLTREELRKIVETGLERANGNYRLMVQLFNIPPDDYKRFLAFLRKHNCHVPFHPFRMARLSRNNGSALSLPELPRVACR